MSNPDSASEGPDGEPRPAIENVLRNETRRRVLSYLCAQGGESSVRAIALRLTDDGDGTMPAVLGTLHDLHLPKLEACGLVEKRADGTVRLRRDPDAVESHLEH